MNKNTAFSQHKLARILWLRVTLSERFDAEGIEQWRQRLRTFLSSHGLNAAISPSCVLVVTPSRPISPFDRGAVIGWLTAQPEVVVVRIERDPGLQRRAQQRLGIAVPSMRAASRFYEGRS